MSTKFIPFQTVITADWLNTIDQTVYEALQSATTAQEARLALSAVEEAPVDGVAYSRSGKQWVATGPGSTNINTRGYDLTDFPGSTWDARFEYALANLESGNRIIVPADNGTPLVFDGSHTLVNDDGRWLQITGNRTKIIVTNIDPWLTIKTIAGPHPSKPKTLVKGLILSAQNLYQGTGIKLVDIGFTNIFECFFERFNNAVHLHNVDYWTEYSTIKDCGFRVNRKALHGSTATLEHQSQRATKLVNCQINTGNIIGNEVDDTEWNYCIYIEDVNWYQGLFIGVGLGIKREFACGVRLSGAGLAGAYGFMESEADIDKYDNVRGIWLNNGTLAPTAPARAPGADITFLMGAISDGTKPNQHVIYDERTNVGVNDELGFRIVSWPGNLKAGKPVGKHDSVKFIAGPAQFGTDTVTHGVENIYTTEGDQIYTEQFDQISGGSVNNWVEYYKASEKNLRTKAQATEVALALGCMPYNPNNYNPSGPLVDGSLNYIDISQANCNIIRISGGSWTAGTVLHQIRGGRLGQIILIESFLSNGGPTLSHNASGVLDGCFQLTGAKDYKFPTNRSGVLAIYSYHVTIGFHWVVINNIQTRSIFLNADRWVPSVTNGCGPLATMEIGASLNNLRYLPFEATVSKSAHIDFTLPDDFLSGGLLNCQIICCTNNAATGIVTWELAGRSYIPPGDITLVMGTPIQLTFDKIVTTAYRSFASNRVDLTLGGVIPAAGNLVHLRLARVAGGMAADVGLLGVRIVYQSIG